MTHSFPKLGSSYLKRQAFHRFSHDHPGRYGVTPDTLTPMLNGNVFGQGYHRPFGSAVGNSDDIASHPGIRGGIDDRSATCRDHMRNRQTATDRERAV